MILEMAAESSRIRKFSGFFSSNPENEEFCAINELPTELLTEILRNLSADDLRNASQTCRRWYQTANESSIRRNTKVVLYEHYNVEQVVEIFQKCEWKHLNLEFRELKLKYYPSTFWENIGDRVYSIEFVDCVLTNDTIKHVILSCGLLQYLSVSDSVNVTHKSTVLPAFLRSLSDLIRRKFVCRNLQSLEITSCYYGSVLGDTLNDIFKVFLGLKSFKLFLSMQKSRNKLDFAVHPCNWTFPDFVSGIACEACQRTGHWKLNTVKIDFLRTVLESTTLASISDFISEHGDVKVVICASADKTDGLFSNKLLRTLLHRCHNLHHLEFAYHIFHSRHHTGLIIDDEIVKALLKHSNLKTFKLRCNKIMLSQVVLKQENLVTNETLRRLYLELGSSPDVANFFLKLFSNLRHLQLRCSGSIHGVLRTIWKYQPNLVTLRIYDLVDRIENTEISERPLSFERQVEAIPNSNDISICRLQRLESLEIVNCDINWEEWMTPAAVINEINFPHLTRFTIMGSLKSSEYLLPAFLFALAHNSPRLEYLKIVYNRTVPFDDFLMCLGQLKRLRVLHIKDSSKFQMLSRLGEDEDLNYEE